PSGLSRARWRRMGSAPAMRKALALGILCLACAARGGKTVRLQGTLEDGAFASQAMVRLEVLETGDTLAVRPGTPFQVALPLDTSWNLCFRAPPSAGGLEKCYVVRHAGADSI